jgi:hypothetical protein
MLLSKISERSQFHTLFSYFSPFSAPLLLIGVLIYIISPIVGCIPLLIFIQIQISRKISKGKLFNNSPFLYDKTNLTLICLVIFATTIYGSTFEVYDDLANFVDTYNKLSGLDISGFYNFFYGKNASRLEPMNFVIPHVFGMVFGHNENHFIIIQSFTFNLSFTLLACIFLSPFYPIVILINIISPFYFYNMFLMRQFYSFIFLIGMFFSPSTLISALLAYFAYLSHKSSLLYTFPLFVASIPIYFTNSVNLLAKSKLINYVSKKITLFYSNYFLIFLTFLSLAVTSYNYFQNLLFKELFVDYAYIYLYKYTGEAFDIKAILIGLFPDLLLLLIVYFIFKRKYLELQFFYFLSVFIVCLITISSFLFSSFLGLNQIFLRPLLSVAALKGFLYPAVFISITQTYGRKTFIASNLLFYLTAFLIALDLLRWLSKVFYWIYLINFDTVKFSFIVSRSVFVNNGTLAVFNSLVDYIDRLNYLIFS